MYIVHGTDARGIEMTVRISSSIIPSHNIFSLFTSSHTLSEIKIHLSTNSIALFNFVVEHQMNKY